MWQSVAAIIKITDLFVLEWWIFTSLYLCFSPHQPRLLRASDPNHKNFSSQVSQNCLASHTDLNWFRKFLSETTVASYFKQFVSTEILAFSPFWRCKFGSLLLEFDLNILIFFQMEVGVSGLSLEAAATNVREELLLGSGITYWAQLILQ